jgi:glycosyltransferase involved in cell wall biosynthesis
MRVVLATDLPVLGSGGLEVLVRELVFGLSNAHEIVLASRDASIDIGSSPLSRHLFEFVPVPDSRRFPEWRHEFARKLRSLAVDLCHFHLGGTFGWASGARGRTPILEVKKHGIPCISTNHQANTPFDVSRSQEPVLRRIAGYLRAMPRKMRCLHAVEREFVVSDYDLAASRKWFPIQAGKFERIYHSRLDAVAPPLPLPGNMVILNLGTICFRKGQHVLAKAFAKVARANPCWKLRLVGNPVETACVDLIRKIALENGIADRLEMPGPTAAPTESIAECDVYVQPSLLEGLGLSLQEAMFYGRPCIGSAIGGIPELIEDQISGILVPPNNVNALANALASVLDDKAARHKFGERARSAIVEKGMTRQAMIQIYLEIYRRIENDRRGRGA